MKWCITFGQQYRCEPHPVLGLIPELADGWVTVTADTELAARRQTADLIGTAWAFIYDARTMPSAYFPAGDLGDLADLVAHATGEGPA